VHPIERLRAVARAGAIDQTVLVQEAVAVLGSFAGDPAGLVTACRRLIDRHPGAGALWWACSRLLAASDVRAEARAIHADLARESVATALSLDLPGGAVVAVVPDVAGGSDLPYDLTSWRDDLVVAHDPGALHVDRDEPRILLVEAGAAGPDRFLAAGGTGDEVAAARDAGVPVWLVVDVGRRLPAPLFAALVDRVSRTPRPERARRPGRGPGSGEVEVVPIGGSGGTTRVGRVVEPRRVACPVAPELLRPLVGW
jgi:hypothetical protein